MTFEDKKNRLKEIYAQFELDAQDYKRNAICRMGCSFCCTDAGSVDITTLEGLIIQQRLNQLPKTTRHQLKKKIARNKRDKEKQKPAACPFLKKDNACLIYTVRPFSCRRLYSVRECKGRGPTVHRGFSELAQKAVLEIQQLDETGYSGHMSYILYLLDQADFKNCYLSGGFDPIRIMDFGKTHGIMIHRSAGAG